MRFLVKEPKNKSVQARPKGQYHSNCGIVGGLVDPIYYSLPKNKNLIILYNNTKVSHLLRNESQGRKLKLLSTTPITTSISYIICC